MKVAVKRFRHKCEAIDYFFNKLLPTMDVQYPFYTSYATTREYNEAWTELLRRLNIRWDFGA